MTAVLLAVSQLVVGVPLVAAAHDSEPRATIQDPPKLPEKVVVANRTAPKGQPPATVFTLPESPTNAELSGAHIFSEPLIPMPRPTTPSENRVLASALRVYAEGRRSEMVAPLLQFLSRYPRSAWKASLLANLGTVYRSTGYLSQALNAWELAWSEARAEADPRAKAVADFAIGEWFDLSHKLGRVTQIVERLQEIEGRPLSGRAAQKMELAKEGVWVTRVHHDVLASGVAAVASIRAFTAYEKHERNVPIAAVQNYRSSPAGMSLSQVKALAAAAGLPWQMMFKPAGQPYQTPAIVHFRANHFVAVVKREGGRYLVIDPVMDGQKWISREALEDEASGYVLAPSSPATNHWRVVPASEAQTVVGHCIPGAPYDLDPGGCPGGGGGPCPCAAGMPQYMLMPMPASLRVQDRPLTYTPAVGPAAMFQLTYNQREGSQPQVYTNGNVGPKWTMDWLSWVSDNPMAEDVEADVSLRGGGGEHYADGVAHAVFEPNWRSKAVLAKVSADPIRYERRLPDGGVEVFAQSDGVITSGRRVYLTDIVDPQGQTVHLTYDASLRLVAVTDATGLVSTLSYELASDPLKITKVTDPYGRFAALTYNAAGQLASITDAINLTSSFIYQLDDFVASMTTPYGTTLFTHETGTGTTTFRSIQATDPLGGAERVEFHWSDASVGATAPANQVPTGFSTYNGNLDHYNSLYWDKRAMALGPGDIATATITRWLLYNYEQYLPFYYSHGFSVSVPHSIKKPLENRVWYAYPDQNPAGSWIGSFRAPTKTARVLDDGTSQISEATYNAQGQVTSQTDSLGRQTAFSYATNGIDLLETRQTTGGINDLLSSFSNYTTGHQPQTAVDAAGQTTTYTYNTAGQVLTTVNPKTETTALTYDAGLHVQQITRAGSVVTSLTYDSFGRIRTDTDAAGYTVTLDYDAFDRLTRMSFPDGTAETLSYDRLDLSQKADRLGRTTRYFYDAVRHLIATRDPQGRTITQQWCKCGSLDKYIDANGHATTWERDVQARVTREVRADSTTAIVSTYEATTRRLHTVTDPLGQVTTYTYASDDTVQEVAFTNAQHATPAVAYSYDPNYRRLVTMTDGAGTTAYAYKAAGVLGALEVASVDGPLTDDTITFEYDALGRATSRAVNAVAATVTYDALGRATSESNVLGTFTTAYVGATQQVSLVTYPNGQTASYTYYPAAGSDRLQTIHHQRPDGSTLSKFDYAYDAVGNVTSWTQQADTAAPTVYSYMYDAADELTTAVQTTADLATVLKRYAYRYDAAGNRTSEQIDDSLATASYDALNRLVARQPGGALRVTGTVDESATVSIDGKAATVGSDGRFEGTTTAQAGTNTFTVSARDGSGNENVATFEMDVAGAGTAYAYDANGNLTSDGVRTFEWDAQNQLLAIDKGTHRSEFLYDGFRRRVRVIERENGSLQSEERLVWCGVEVCEERAADGTAVTRRSFLHGEQIGSAQRYFTTDHLGSVREVTDTSGGLLGRYSFDPWGRRTIAAGTDITYVGFTADRWEQNSALWLTQYRIFDSDSGRWLSEDPLGLRGGTDFYAYSWNNPVRFVDPLGLKPSTTESNWHGNYCGPGGSGATKDGLDIACQHHDACYDALGLGGIADGLSTGSECKQNCDNRLCREASEFHSYDFESARARAVVLLMFCRSRAPSIQPPDMFPLQWNPM